MKRLAKILFLLVIGVFLLYPGTISAKSHGEAVNLQAKTDTRALKINENINISLYPDYALISQLYLINTLENQKIDFILPARLYDNENIENNYLENLEITFNNEPVQAQIGLVEVNNIKQLNFNFSVDLKNVQNQIKITYKIKNRSDINGWRGFDYIFRGFNNFFLDKLTINLNLFGGITPENFQKTYRPEADIKLEPYNYDLDNHTYTWILASITPGFDLKAYFYWPDGDLVNKPDLNKTYNLSLNKNVLGSKTEIKKPAFWERVKTNVNYLYFKVINIFER